MIKKSSIFFSLLSVLLLLGCSNEQGLNPSKISIFFQSEQTRNTFIFDAKIKSDDSFIVFSTVGDSDFENSILDKPEFSILKLNPAGNVEWDTIIRGILPVEKIGFPSFCIQQDDSTYIWSWNITDGLIYIVTVELNQQSRLKRIEAKEFLTADTRFDTLSRNYTIHRIKKTSSGFALLMLGTIHPNFSVLVVEVDRDFKTILGPPRGVSFAPEFFFSEHIVGNNLPQNVISVLDGRLFLEMAPANHFYFVAPDNSSGSFAIFSTQFSQPLISSSELEVTAIANTQQGSLSGSMISKVNPNKSYFFKDILVNRFSKITKAQTEQSVDNQNIYSMNFLSSSYPTLITQTSESEFLVCGTTSQGGMVINAIKGQRLRTDFFENQKNVFALNNVLSSSNEAIFLGQTNVYRIYSRTFMIKIPYSSLFD